MAKIIFAGTTEFGIPALEMLMKEHDLSLVITQPDRPVGRKKILSSPAIKIWAMAKGIKTVQPEKIADASPEIQAIDPDLLIVAAYGQIIPKHILEIPKHGSINLHSSLLPKYRGASPIQAALLNDEKETGVTIMRMDEKLDHGAIYSQTKVAIEENDNYSSLHEKLATTAAELLAKTIPQILDNLLTPKEQDHSQATIVTNINRDHAKIDWTQPARKILSKIKALNPEPGTWTTLNKKSVKIMAAEEARSGRVDLPGKIYADGKDCLVKCGDYSLKLLMVQPEGKKPMTGQEFLNGIKNLETKILV
jgi:methionyl-tRNA formyltransferase